MKRFLVTGVLTLLITAPAFANDPSMPSGGTSSSGDTTPRGKWTKNRLEQLHQRKQHYKTHGHPGGDIRDGAGGLPDNPYLNGDDAALRRRDTIRRQHEIDQIEFLALKKERGELSPAGQKKLNQLIRHVQNQ
jgi:hypothetical protein